MTRAANDSIDITVHETGPREVIAIGIPSWGMVHLFFCGRLFNLRHPMNRIVRQFYLVGKEVGAARNEIAAKALAIDNAHEKCTKLLFIDDDVLFHPDSLLKLMSHNRPIVSGLYYTKTSVPTPLVLHGQYEGTARSWRPGDLIDCEGHGMGLCLIDTDVLRRVRDEIDLGVDAYGFPAWFQTKKDHDVVRADGTPAFHSETEDWNFLSKARQLGYQPCVDTSPQTFAWHLDTKHMRVYPEKQWHEFTTKGTITWETDHGAVTWGEMEAA